MMRKLSSFVAQNCRSGRFFRSGRGFSSSASPEEASWVPPLMFVSSFIGFGAYIISDIVNDKRNRKRLRKIAEEADYFRKIYTEKREEYKNRRKEIFGTN